MSRVFLAVALLAAPVSAAADPEIHATATATADHAIYLDILGRAGLWGIGYDWQPHRWFALGAVASYYSFDGDRVTTFAPYVAAYPIGRGHHRGFLQLGGSLVRRVTPSPVPEWNGVTTYQVGTAMCAGYEYRNGFLFRVYAMASRGDHLAPWLGASVGWTL